VANFVAGALQSAGYGVDVCDDGRQGLTMALRGMYTLVILDLSLPTLAGEAVLIELLQHRPEQEVMVLSGRTEVDDRVRLLELGAADYLTKPFAVAELVARVRARVREAEVVSAKRRPSTADRTDDRTIETDGGRVNLTDYEYRLLRHLRDRTGRTCSREELLADVWGMWFDPGSNLVEVTIRRVRRKLGQQSIETIRGVGYRIPA
jgi:DNA-binding response OmpR family regulator